MDKVMLNEKGLMKDLTKLSIEIFYMIKLLIINLDNMPKYEEYINDSIMIIHEFVASLVQIANKMKYNEIIRDTINYLKWHLYMSISLQSSHMIREIFYKRFNITYNISDNLILKSKIVSYGESPRIFEDLNTNDYLNMEDNFDCNFVKFNSSVAKIKFGYKSISSYFKSSYTTSYPYSAEECMNYINQRILQESRMFLLFENYLLWYKGMIQNYDNTIQELMLNENSFLSMNCKYYFAIMGVSTIKSQYLLGYLEFEFLRNGGDIEWLLDGLNSVPEKISCFGNVNNRLAHRPWDFDEKNLIEFKKKGWNNEEIIEIILILTTYHRIASLNEGLYYIFYESEEESNKIIALNKFYNTENKAEDLIHDLESLNNSDNENEFDECYCKNNIIS